MSPAAASPSLDVGALLADPAIKVIVTCGSGGVGKTTTAAAMGLRAAEQGRRVAVLTIDPARRLAQSMGLTELDNTPRPVPGIAADGNGALFAMMLDMKRTFDDVVEQHSTPDRAQAIFDNPFYQALSSSFAGTQEYMAMEKLGQLREMLGTPEAPNPDSQWDLIIVDTPPARSALDFLDAPQRLGRFLDGRMIKLLTAPSKAYFKVVGASFTLFTKMLTKVLGTDLLSDVSTFVSSLEAMFGGFRERAEHTYALLKAPDTAFLVVASPEPDALREASFFVERLADEAMPLAGLIVNRVHAAAAPLSAAAADTAADALGAAPRPRRRPAKKTADAEAAAARPAKEPSERDRGVAAAALRIQAEAATLAAHDARMMRRFAAAHPDTPMATVAALATDVHDLDSLRRVGDLLVGLDDRA